MSTYTHDNLSWLNFQHIKKSEFRICLKELFADQHDPVTVSYVILAGEYFYMTKTKWFSNALTKFWFTYGQRTGILRACFFFFFISFFFFLHGALFGEDVCKPGWSYFSGVCYSTSQSCKNWTEAQKTCQRDNANLVAIKTQEANVYVQHRLNGEKGWIGLNDRDAEGTFVWAGNQSSNFTYWAPNQPNDFRLDEDCVHTLGVGHSFEWNDVSCGSCHNFTCSEGKGIVISQVHISQIMHQLRILSCWR